MNNEKWLNLKGVLSCFPWMCAIPIYDYGELHVSSYVELELE